MTDILIARPATSAWTRGLPAAAFIVADAESYAPDRQFDRIVRAHGVAVRCFSLAEIEGLCTASGWELEAHRAVWPLVHVRRLAATSKQGGAG